MSANLLTVDRTTLPASMLELAKAHLRVRHARDDGLIAQHLAVAIETVERRCSINLNPAVFALDVYHLEPMPSQAWPTRGRWALPVNNVQTFTLTDAEGVDQALDYSIEQADAGGAAGAYLTGPPVPAAGWAMTAEVGVDDVEAMAPAVLGVVLRLTGGLYENRESPSAVLVDDFLGELMGVWRPAA